MSRREAQLRRELESTKEREAFWMAEAERQTQNVAARVEVPIPMLLWCPECCARHIDVGEFATKQHHTHACQECGMVWRPAVAPTVGVSFLPGFRNQP